ncbi:MAG TPA: hypothetical protein VJB35_06585 [Candidatus Nanoarchaeia archaeon]|nr:hypothetical protein [Candidatus Nanoarchaeia archaeon]
MNTIGIGIVIGAGLLLSQIVVPLAMLTTQVIGKAFGYTVFKK